MAISNTINGTLGVNYGQGGSYKAPSFPIKKSPVASTILPPLNYQTAPASASAIGSANSNGQTDVGATIQKDNSALLASSTAAANKAAQVATGGSYTQAGGYVPGLIKPPATDPNAAPQTPPATGYAPTPGNPLISGLANTSQYGSQNATSATSGLLQAPSQNASLIQQAQNIGADYSAQASKISNYGNALAGSYKNGAGLAPVSQGLAGIAQNTTSNQLQGLLSAENLALNPLDRQLTAQGQAQSGLANAGGIANTQQANIQSGLSTAAGYAQPQTTTPGQAVFQPGTGTYSNASSGGGSPGIAPSGIDQNSWNQYIQDFAMGNTAAIPSGVLSNVNLAGQLQAAVQSGNPNFDYSTTAGAAEARTSVASTQEQQKAAYQSAHQQALNLQSQLTDLISNFGLNPNNLNAANAGIQAIAKNTSSANYKILDNYLSDIASRYSQILTPPGGSATDTTRSVATGMLDKLASGQSIIDVMNALDSQAQAVTAGVTTYKGSSGRNLSPSASSVANISAWPGFN